MRRRVERQANQLSTDHHRTERTDDAIAFPFALRASVYAMDQQAFRQLLATPRNTSSAPQQTPAHAGRGERALGKPRKRGPGPGVEHDKIHDLLPRNVASAKQAPHAAHASSTSHGLPKKSAAGGAYIDRAEARRLGLEGANEFENVERLQEDFEKRIADAKDDEEKKRVSAHSQCIKTILSHSRTSPQLQEQMAFLGGDAKHSVLVKGLDFALLEQQKAKLQEKSRDAIGTEEEDLEAAFATSSQRKHAGAPAEEAKHSTSKKPKFRPFGQSGGLASVHKSFNETKTHELPEYIWRNGKRMRKKRRNQEEPRGEGAASTDRGDRGSGAEAQSVSDRQPCVIGERSKERHDAEAQVRDRGGKEGHIEGSAFRSALDTMEGGGRAEESTMEGIDVVAAQSDLMGREKGVQNPIVAAENANPSAAEEEEEEDIFADAGRWQGIDDDESTSGEEEGASEPPVKTSTQGKRDWFSTSTRKEEVMEGADAPSQGEVQDLLAAAQDTLGHEGRQDEEARKKSGTENDAKSDEDMADGAEDGAAAGHHQARLLGLSDSSLPTDDIRSLLADAQQKKLDGQRGGEGRRERRRRRRGGGHDSE